MNLCLKVTLRGAVTKNNIRHLNTMLITVLDHEMHECHIQNINKGKYVKLNELKTRIMHINLQLGYIILANNVNFIT